VRLVGTTWSCRAHDLLTALGILRTAGFDEVEVWADGVHLDPRASPDVAAVRRWVEAHGVAVRSVHLPFDVPEEAWLEQCVTVIGYARELGARVAVLHPVLFSGGVDRLVATADDIAAEASAAGIGLVLENLHTLRGPTLTSVAELRQAIARMDHPAGICLDIGHAVFNGHVGDGLVGEITAAGDLLRHTHVHDSDAVGRDPHLTPGDGLVDWPQALAAYRTIDYAGAYVVEVAGGDDPLTTLTTARARLLSYGPASVPR